MFSLPKISSEFGIAYFVVEYSVFIRGGNTLLPLKQAKLTEFQLATLSGAQPGKTLRLDDLANGIGKIMWFGTCIVLLTFLNQYSKIYFLPLTVYTSP